MPLSTSLVGQATTVRAHKVDARWTMAYAAGIGDRNALYFDNRGGDLCVHPVFPVCVEWPSILDMRALPANQSLTEKEAARGVHASHDLHLLKPLQVGMHYETWVQVVGCIPSPGGGRVIMQIDTSDEAHELVTRTWQTSVYRDVSIEGEPCSALAEPPQWPSPQMMKGLASGSAEPQLPISIEPGLGNVYTETARIFNPIHSDRAYAEAAGLPDTILHGTASLALCVTALVDQRLDGQSNRVIRLGGQFAGIVSMPNQLSVVVTGAYESGCFFELKDQAGQTVIKRGFLQWR